MHKNQLFSNTDVTHYHCEGSCKGTSHKPGSCGAETCELFGEPLTACEGKKCAK